MHRGEDDADVDEEDLMPGLFNKVAKFASSPQGRRVINQAKAAAAKPENRAKIDQLVNKVQRKGGQPPSQPR